MLMYLYIIHMNQSLKMEHMQLNVKEIKWKRAHKNDWLSCKKKLANTIITV